MQRLNKVNDEHIQQQINRNRLNKYTTIHDYLHSSLPPSAPDGHHLNNDKNKYKI